MNQKFLERVMKIIMVGLALCGAFVFIWIIPQTGLSIVESYPEFNDWYTPWLVFISIAAIPCYAVLVFGWKIAMNIGKNNAFCMSNAKSLRCVSVLALCDSAYFLLGNIMLWLFGKNHPSVLLASLLVAFIGTAISVAASVLSHLVKKAAMIKSENDLTI